MNAKAETAATARSTHFFCLSGRSLNSFMIFFFSNRKSRSYNILFFWHVIKCFWYYFLLFWQRKKILSSPLSVCPSVRVEFKIRLPQDIHTNKTEKIDVSAPKKIDVLFSEAFRRNNCFCLLKTITLCKKASMYCLMNIQEIKTNFAR